MADDEDAIFIDVIPRVDDSAADSAVSKLKDKFKDVAGNIAPDFMDALNNSGVLEEFGKKVGSAVSEAVGSDVKEMSSSIGVDLEDAIGKVINKDWTGLGTSLGKGLGGKLTEALGINELLGSDGIDGVIDKVHTLKDTITSFRGGDLGGGLGGASSLLQGLGLPGAGVLDDFKNANDQVHSTLKDLAETFGPTAGSLLSKLVYPIAGTVATVQGLQALRGSQSMDDLGGPDVLNRLIEEGVLPQGTTASQAVGMTPGQLFPAQTLGSTSDSTAGLLGTQSVPGVNVYDRKPAQPAANSVLLPPGISQGAPKPQLSEGGLAGGSAQEVEVSSQSTTVTTGQVFLSGSVNLGGLSLPTGQSNASAVHAMPGTGAAHAGWFGTPKTTAPTDLGGLMGGHHTGGVIPGDSPGYDNTIGVLPGGSAVGLEGGEGVVRTSVMQQPGIASLITQLNKGYDEGTSSPAGVGGDSNNPSLSTPPTQPNTAGGGGQGIQQQQLGTGQGGGISGGGIIGAAEQAGVAAAGVAGFGGGAIAAQMAVQETNLAVQKASQSAAALATAPFETFGLAGGMMGAPKVNPMGGWIGKLIAGELGSQTNLPNLAGASTQPPKKPDQKQPGDDQQGQGESPSGPSGAKDDPMHVNVTNQPSPQQGSATSAMNATPGLTMSVP